MSSGSRERVHEGFNESSFTLLHARPSRRGGRRALHLTCSAVICGRKSHLVPLQLCSDSLGILLVLRGFGLLRIGGLRDLLALWLRHGFRLLLLQLLHAARPPLAPALLPPVCVLSCFLWRFFHCRSCFLLLQVLRVGAGEEATLLESAFRADYLFLRHI